MRFLLNMNISREVGAVLADLGNEWAHARDLDLVTADDRAVVARARRESRVIVTHDLDYADLLMLSGARQPSAIIFRLRVSSPKAMGDRIRRVWETIRRPLEEGAIAVIDDAKVRIRSLSVESP